MVTISWYTIQLSDSQTVIQLKIFIQCIDVYIWIWQYLKYRVGDLQGAGSQFDTGKIILP